MARIKNIELPGDKHTCIGLTAIYGIGRSLANQICDAAGVERSKKIKDLTEDEIIKLRSEIDKCRIIKRKGKVMVICENPKHKQVQG